MVTVWTLRVAFLQILLISEVCAQCTYELFRDQSLQNVTGTNIIRKIEVKSLAKCEVLCELA